MRSVARALPIQPSSLSVSIPLMSKRMRQRVEEQHVDGIGCQQAQNPQLLLPHGFTAIFGIDRDGNRPFRFGLGLAFASSLVHLRPSLHGIGDMAVKLLTERLPEDHKIAL